jgi:hypothetical protein
MNKNYQKTHQNYMQSDQKQMEPNQSFTTNKKMNKWKIYPTVILKNGKIHHNKNKVNPLLSSIVKLII